MARAFTDADIAQENTGALINSNTVVATLPSGTTEGNAGITVVGGGNIFDPPEQWHAVASSGGSGETQPQLLIACRADIPAGESSWSFGVVGGSNTNGHWLMQEWRNVSFCPVVAKDFNPLDAGGATSVALSADLQGDLVPAYNVALAAIGIIGSGAAPAPWSAVTWSGGFTEVNVLTTGTGQVNGDIRLHVARRYGALNEGGPWATTATFTDGAQTNKTIYAALAVFRAEHHVGEA